MKTTTTPVTHRILSLGAAATLASVGLVGLSAPAQAASADSQVWVCKYVGKPGVDERLKDGKNPIEVSGHTLVTDPDAQIYVGDSFPDAQGRSLVVQIGGSEPGKGSCAPTPPVGPTPPDTPTPPGTTPAGGTPGHGAPHTGGDGSGMPVGLAGGGVLILGAGALAAAAQRRRRAATRS